MQSPTEHERRFAERLKKLADDEDRAALAALRRALGKMPGEVPEACRFVDPWLDPGGSGWDEETHYLVAGLFGLHQGSWAVGEEQRSASNLGASFGRLQQSALGGSVERRFVALLSAEREDVPEHLRHLVGLLKAKGIPVDWAQLLHDLRGWNHPRRVVQRQWALAFWRSEGPGQDAAGSKQGPAAPAEGTDLDNGSSPFTLRMSLD